MKEDQKNKQIGKIEIMKNFEENGEANFGSRISKIDWWGIIKKAAILIWIILILVLILK